MSRVGPGGCNRYESHAQRALALGTTLARLTAVSESRFVVEASVNQGFDPNHSVRLLGAASNEWSDGHQASSRAPKLG